MIRCALYARYSSDNQRDASIEDQSLLCREHAEKQGWHVAESYADHAISGANLLHIKSLSQTAFWFATWSLVDVRMRSHPLRARRVARQF